ncbi:MAG: hypothetical protein HC795_15070 [Coleofasciculaceae cyanobacterium RL_1_1]|nr:hypothetical protein [Coleofasciculaceae cyanobacterium RL_1_1]
MSNPVTQVTFHLQNGEQEAFSLPMTPEMFLQQLQISLDAPLLVFQLIDQSICIKPDSIVKLEIEPPCTGVTGSFLFAKAERVTAMTRGSWR